MGAITKCVKKGSVQKFESLREDPSARKKSMVKKKQSFIQNTRGSISLQDSMGPPCFLYKAG